MNVVVTGASRGIGKAIAGTFAKQGHNLFISSKTATSLYRAMEELLTAFPSVSVKAIPFDLSKKEEAIAFGNWVLEQNTALDVLVNNAGSFEPGSVYNEPDGLLESQLATNLYSAYHLTRTLLPSMMNRKQGHVFNICSVASVAAYDNGGAYSISKTALYAFSKNLREEMKSHGIKVTAVIAGAVNTDSWEGFDNSAQRIMEPEDIAKLIYAATQLSPAACVEEILVRPLEGDL